MRHFISWKVIVAAALCAPTLAACERYSADPIEAWVIDAETEKPIEGVVVTANWQLTGGLEGGYPKGQLMVMETMTDKTGRFFFPGWGPKWHLGEGKLRENQPQLLMFKSGYHYRRLHNEVSSVEVYSGKSEWSGRRIEFKPHKGKFDDYIIKLFRSFSDDVESIAAREPNDCDWKKIPKTIRTISRERKELVAQGANSNTLPSVEEDLIRNDEYFIKKGGCGSPKEFFKDVEQ